MAAGKTEKYRTSIGGQALLEGVMMRGPKKTAIAVRRPDGELQVETWDTEGLKCRKIPLVRGICSLVSGLKIGYRAMMRSAEISGEDEEEDDAFSRWLDRKFGEKAEKTVEAVVYVISVVLAIALFVVLPTFVTGLLSKVLPIQGIMSLVEGILKVLIFLLYLWSISRMKEISRVFAYHGAEHKTIACYEAGDEMKVENIRNYSRFHPRCGTSFLFIAVTVGIIIFAFIPWRGTFYRALLKLALLPVIAGISYELLKYSGTHDGPVARTLAAPGLWMQRLTTKEPDDSMIEAALAAFMAVLPGDGSDIC
ncbi:MAG: DUF1385 domain-containing protein [Oscillospiraceae bacterium]|jgi:uncharacterized protein YqhQ